MWSLFVFLLVVPFIYADRQLPYIIPDGGYNSSLGGSAVEFVCELPSAVHSFVWLINGETAQKIGLEILLEKGITSDNTLVGEESRTFTTISIEPRLENNNTSFTCVANFLLTAPLISAEVVFRVQGLLDPSPNLEIGHHNTTHMVLRWSPPFTLDLTAYEEDITGYSVTLEMESPPPHDPYDLSVSRDNLSSTSNETWSLPGHSLEFFFPRFSFPVWLSVRGENPVGLGAPSPPLQYSPPSHCTRLKDVVSESDLKANVEFSTISLAPTVEVLLYAVPPEGRDMCIDSVVVTLTSQAMRVDQYNGSTSGSGDTGSAEESLILLPVVTEEGISLVLGQHLLIPHTHYTATLSLQSGHFITTHFSTHHVQSVTVREEEGNGLKVECLFAQGSPESTTCTVVVEGEEGGWNETFRGSFLFPHLPTGIYNITVYDGATIENQEPAVVIVIEIDGEPTTSSTSPDSTSDTAGNSDPTVHSSWSKKDSISRNTLTVVIGVSGGLLVLLLLGGILCLLTLLLGLRRRRRSASYDLKKFENQLSKEPPNASNPLSTGVLETATEKPPEESAQNGLPRLEELESPYEVVDQEEARALREKKERERREREEKARSAAAPVYTEEELSEIRRHTYSTVDLNKKKKQGKKKDKKKRESSPPPVPPQAFNYLEEFPEPAVPTADNHPSPQAQDSSHVYDSLQTATSSPLPPLATGATGAMGTDQQQGPSPVPPTNGGDTKKAGGDPVYETISGMTVTSHQSPSSSSSSSSPSSPTEEKETTRLILERVAPDLPPRSPHLMTRIVNRPSASRRNGSRYSMIERGSSSSPAQLPRPLSAHITQFPTSTTSTTDSSPLTRGDGGLESGGKNASLPTLPNI